MDINLKEKVEELVNKIKNDKNIAAKFQKDPVATVESLLGIDLPNEQIDSVVDMVKAKVNLDSLGDALGGLKGLFNK